MSYAAFLANHSILHLSQETDGNMLSGTIVTGCIVVLITVFVMCIFSLPIVAAEMKGTKRSRARKHDTLVTICLLLFTQYYCLYVREITQVLVVGFLWVLCLLFS